MSILKFVWSIFKLQLTARSYPKCGTRSQQALIEDKTTLGERNFLTKKPAFWVGAVSGRFYHQWLFIKLLNSDFPIGLSNKEPCSPPVISINWLFWQLEQLSTSCLKVGQVYS